MKVTCPDCGGKYHQKGLGVHRARFCPTKKLHEFARIAAKSDLPNHVVRIHWHCDTCLSGGYFTKRPTATLDNVIETMTKQHDVDSLCSASPALGESKT